MSDMTKISKLLQKSRAPDAPKFTCYDRVPNSNPPDDYFKFWILAANLEAPAVNLYTYQHLIRDVFVQSSEQASSCAPASKVRYLIAARNVSSGK